MMNELLNNATLLIAAIGVLAFIVSLITQVFKGVGVLNKLPTDLLVLILSIALTIASLVAYAQYSEIALIWYMIVAAVIVGFIVAFVAMYGWDKLSELWSRFKNNKAL